MYEIKPLFQGRTFVKEIESLSETSKKDLTSRNCKIIFTDFSVLYIRETWKEGELLKYAYFWFTAIGALIVGWDNAPHHTEAETFPHHKHKADSIEPSAERDLQDVSKYIAESFS